MMNLLRISALLAVAVLAACTSTGDTRDPSPPPEAGGTAPADSYPYRKSTGVLPRQPEEVSGPAVLSLLSQARGDLEGGRPELAASALERAQRIEPRNPFIWQQLAAAHLRQNRLLETENMAQRSNSLARGNPYIEIENWRMIAAARRGRGDRAGADEAEARIVRMQETLDP